MAKSFIVTLTFFFLHFMVDHWKFIADLGNLCLFIVTAKAFFFAIFVQKKGSTLKPQYFTFYSQASKIAWL